jgi:hypothetical protein
LQHRLTAAELCKWPNLTDFPDTDTDTGMEQDNDGMRRHGHGHGHEYTWKISIGATES